MDGIFTHVIRAKAGRDDGEPSRDRSSQIAGPVDAISRACSYKGDLFIDSPKIAFRNAFIRQELESFGALGSG
jgi:hypothetical protein